VKGPGGGKRKRGTTVNGRVLENRVPRCQGREPSKRFGQKKLKIGKGGRGLQATQEVGKKMPLGGASKVGRQEKTGEKTPGKFLTKDTSPRGRTGLHNGKKGTPGGERGENEGDFLQNHALNHRSTKAYRRGCCEGQNPTPQGKEEKGQTARVSEMRLRADAVHQPCHGGKQHLGKRCGTKGGEKQRLGCSTGS